MTVYDFLLKKLVLSDEHHKQLIDRGFTPQTIKRCKFVSGGEYISAFDKDLREEFTTEELITSCIYTETEPSEGEKTEKITQILLENRIIIPYIDQNDVCYNLRPHKLGLTGKEPQIYQKCDIKENETVIITEGEFKAAAAVQIGLSCVAIPGISSFADKHKGRLCETLKDYKVKNAIIVFDKEIKDDPKLPNYKENKHKRWDTPYFAWYMAQEMTKVGIKTRIAELPESWMENGKVDIDLAVKRGKTIEDFFRFLNRAQECDAYLDSLPREAQTVIKKRISKKLFPSKIFKYQNKYFKRSEDGEKKFPISNFVLNIVSTHHTPEGLLRKVVFENEFKELSEPMYIEAGQMVSADGFASFCMSKGNFIWTGAKQDIMTIWSDEFLEEGGVEIYEPDHIGKLDQTGMWLFGNMAIDKSGTDLAIREGAFFNEDRGYKPNPIDISGSVDCLPNISTEQINIEEIYEKFSDTLGKNMAALVIGWVGAIPYMDEVFKDYGCFPFLFVTGKRGSGKSTIAEWIMNFFGIEGSGKLLSDTTSVYIQRAMAYYSCLPLFLDEYRNSNEVMKKNALFRNAYNRQSAGKGVKDSFGIREGKIRGTLLISGEETPNDNAVLSRCVVINVMKKHRSENQYRWFAQNKNRFSYIFYKIIKENNSKEFIAAVEKMRKKFIDFELNDRIAINFAIVAAGFVSLMRKSEKECLEFLKFICEHASVEQTSQEDESQLNIFFSDLATMKLHKGFELNKLYEIKKHQRTGEELLYLHMGAIHSVWCEFWKRTRTGEDPFKKTAIIGQLREEKYFHDFKSARVHKSVVQCVVLNLSLMSKEHQSIFKEVDTFGILSEKVGGEDA